MSMEVKRTGRKHAEWKIAVIVTSGLLLAVGIFLFYFKVYQVAPVFSEATYEYGTRISREITDYISGTEWSVNLGELDLSGVNEGRTGTYEAVVRHGGSQFAYTITIQDTVAPEIRWKEGPVYLAVDTACRVEDVVEGVMDTQVQTFFLREGVTLEEISFDRTGEYDLEILARDRAGNESWGRVRVIVDTPPVFAGLHDFYMVPGSEPDYLENVEAWDRRDGDLTECIEVDDDLVNAEKEGVYTLRYLVSDLCGLESVGEAQVTVASPEEIQSMIGRRQIDYRVDTILGAPNVYDAGASEQEDLDAALKDLRPRWCSSTMPQAGAATVPVPAILWRSPRTAYISVPIVMWWKNTTSGMCTFLTAPGCRGRLWAPVRDMTWGWPGWPWRMFPRNC